MEGPPARGVKTRSMYRLEAASAQDGGDGDSDGQRRLTQVIRTHEVSQAESAPTQMEEGCGGGATSTVRSISSTVKRKQLEYEAAQARAKVELDLINKKLELDLEILSEGSVNRFLSRSQSNGEQERIINWIDQSIRQDGGGGNTHLAADLAATSGSARLDIERGKAAATARTESGGTISSRRGRGGAEDRIVAAATVTGAEAMKKTIMSASVPNAPQKDLQLRLLSRLSTPKELPKFSGDPLEWLHFRSSYVESTELGQFTDAENRWRLRSCLQGAAKEAVSALLASGCTAEEVIRALQMTFGRPELIVGQMVVSLKNISPLPSAYQAEISRFTTKIRNFVAAMKSIEQEDYVRSPEILNMILQKLPSTLTCKWTDYGFQNLHGGKPKLVVLSDFLEQEALKISTVGYALVPEMSKKRVEEEKRPRVHTVLFNEIPVKCEFCKKASHKLQDCKRFTKVPTKSRWSFVKRARVCFNCLLAGHNCTSCSSTRCGVNECELPHHRLLHFNVAKKEEPKVEVVAHVNNNALRCMTKIVKVRVYGTLGAEDVYALLDDGSYVTLIEKELADRIGLHGRPQNIFMKGAFKESATCAKSESVEMEVSGESGEKYFINAQKTEKLELPTHDCTTVDPAKFSHLHKIIGLTVTEAVRPNILIGSDNYHLLAPIELIHGAVNEPYATLCPLGWTVHGNHGGGGGGSGGARGGTPTPSRAPVLFVAEAENEVNELRKLNDLIKNSFSIDSIGIDSSARVHKDDFHATEILEDTARRIDDRGERWEVGLPWKQDHMKMPDTYAAALSRLKSLERKFTHDPHFAEKYRLQMKNLFDSGYAREVTKEEHDSEHSHLWYLPHFAVRNINKPDKIRVVMDAAATVSGFCLNDYLFTGPDLLISLLGVTMRFREKKIAITGDLKEMFLQVRIRKEDMQAQRFLWRENEMEPPKKYVMTSLIFGANSSPFVAQFIKNKNAEEYKQEYADASAAIVNNHYMDNWLESAQDEVSAMKLVRDVTYIHQRGGFEMRGWACNSTKVLDEIPTASLAPSAVQLKAGVEDVSERTLGLLWYPKVDEFGFDVSLKKVPSEIVNGERIPTKREMLRATMSIFDVLGFLAPLTIRSKILLQDVWRSGISWDEHLNEPEQKKFQEWINRLNHISSLRIPRFYIDIQSVNLQIIHTELHVYCDASEKASACVAYWRFIKSDESVSVVFIASKSKVAPLRPMSIPRMELTGALLASRLAATIEKEHTIKPKRRIFWTDSTTVLRWIRSDPRQFKMFVAYRLGEIDELTDVSEWRFVPTKLNAADVATRDDAENLQYESIWFRGPEYLRRTEDEWPQDYLNQRATVDDSDCSERKHPVLLLQEEKHDLPVPDCSRFSSWNLLRRSTARILQFINLCKKKERLSTVELEERAEKLLLKQSQHESFHQEIEIISKGLPLHHKSRIVQLDPLLDEDGILRLGGRVDAVKCVSEGQKRPIILDGKHHIARLITKHQHEKCMHGSTETVVNEIRQRLWIIQLRPTVRTIASRCTRCRILRAIPRTPKMGNLPSDRLDHHTPPFTRCGVDLFGPMEVSIGRRREKRYGVIFTCLTVRAVHLEIVSSLTTDSLIMALRRMASRRSLPLTLYSDNGTNMRGADQELRRALKELDNDKLYDEASKRGVQWLFIPPSSPHMDGAWERLIRTLKTSLRVVLRERAPREEVLQTLFAEVEHLMNSRPLTFVSVDSRDPEALTPNHFLIGRSSNAPPPCNFGEAGRVDLRRQWRFSQALVDLWWKRWLREYLPLLLRRTKWTREQRPLQIGDVVIVAEPNLPRCTWLKGRVEKIYPGADGRVRVAEVKTKNGLLRRPVAKLAYLTGGSEEYFPY